MYDDRDAAGLHLVGCRVAFFEMEVLQHAFFVGHFVSMLLEYGMKGLKTFPFLSIHTHNFDVRELVGQEDSKQAVATGEVVQTRNFVKSVPLPYVPACLAKYFHCFKNFLHAYWRWG